MSYHVNRQPPPALLAYLQVLPMYSDGNAHEHILRPLHDFGSEPEQVRPLKSLLRENHSIESTRHNEFSPSDHAFAATCFREHARTHGHARGATLSWGHALRHCPRHTLVDTHLLDISWHEGDSKHSCGSGD